jgi:hypothetical protein
MIQNKLIEFFFVLAVNQFSKESGNANTSYTNETTTTTAAAASNNTYWNSGGGNNNGDNEPNNLSGYDSSFIINELENENDDGDLEDMMGEEDFFNENSHANVEEHDTAENEKEEDNDDENDGDNGENQAGSVFLGEPLDPVALSRMVKDKLVENRIGQRLFAKVYLGITQARLSELLLKPKPWSQCTEHRKAVYMRMHEWAMSDKSIAAVKALTPSCKELRGLV